MADKDQQQRRAKRLAKQRKKRSTSSRPGRDGGSARAPSFKAALGWPVGECYLSSDWDKPGAVVHAAFARSHSDGRTVAAFVHIDRSGPGVLSARVTSLPTAQSVIAECIQIAGDDDDLAFAGAPPSVVAGLLLDAAENGANTPPDAWSRVRTLLEDVEPDSMDVAFGEAPAGEAPPSGLLDRLFRWLG